MKLTYSLPRVLGSLQVPGTPYVCGTPCNARMGIAAPLGFVMPRWPVTTFRLFFERPELILHHEPQQLKTRRPNTYTSFGSFQVLASTTKWSPSEGMHTVVPCLDRRVEWGGAFVRDKNLSTTNWSETKQPCFGGMQPSSVLISPVDPSP
jgi:hypothetical protein